MGRPLAEHWTLGQLVDLTAPSGGSTRQKQLWMSFTAALDFHTKQISGHQLSIWFTKTQLRTTPANFPSGSNDACDGKSGKTASWDESWRRKIKSVRGNMIFFFFRALNLDSYRQALMLNQMARVANFRFPDKNNNLRNTEAIEDKAPGEMKTRRGYLEQKTC